MAKQIVMVKTYMILAMSGQAHAGATILKKRCWPSEVMLSSQTAAQPQDVFGSEIPPPKNCTGWTPILWRSQVHPLKIWAEAGSSEEAHDGSVS
jgi:hypothetical protein